MSQYGRAVKSVFIIIVFTLGSKLLGLARESLIAAKFGAGKETDAYFLAISAATLLTMLLVQTINVTAIPVLSEVESREGKSGKRIHTNNLLNITFFVSIALILLGWLLAPALISILGYGFAGEQYELAVRLMRIGLPVIVFAGVVGVFRGYLQSEMMFTESAAAQLPFNFVYILFLVFLSGTFGIKGLMAASVLAVCAQIIIQIPGVRKAGYRYEFVLDIKDKYIKKIAKLAPPVLASLAVSNLNTLVDKALASTLAVGSISALSYGIRLKDIILGIFIVAITTVIFPIFSREANKANHQGIEKAIRNGFNIIQLITIPATVGIIVLAQPLVKIVFERGAFDFNASQMTAGALIFYSLGLIGMAFKIILDRAYYSFQDTRTPMIVGFIGAGANIILNLILIRFMEHRGLALATSISATIMAGLLLYGLKKKIPSLSTSNLAICASKSLAASLAMGVLVYYLYNTLDKAIGGSAVADLLVLLSAAGAGALVYAVILYLFKVEEIEWCIKLIKNKISKNKHVIKL